MFRPQTLLASSRNRHAYNARPGAWQLRSRQGVRRYLEQVMQQLVRAGI
jgi:hypothetical protein